MKTDWNKYADIAMLVDFVPLAASSVAVWLLPSGPGSGAYALLGIARHQWLQMHDVSGWLMLALIGVHVALHLKVIACWAKRR